MIHCLICGKEYKKILKTHLVKHGITREEYILRFPDALLIDGALRDTYAQSTAIYLKSLTDSEKKARTYVRTEQVKEKNRESALQYYESHPEYVDRYTDSRNEKIAAAKKQWWTAVGTEQRSSILKKTQQIHKQEVGDEKYREIKRINGSKAKIKFDSQDNIQYSSSFELEMYKFLSEHNVKYIPQFNVRGWFFDCYIPGKNLLIEFDGDFWHPLTIEDCKYDFQVKKLHTDGLKNNVAVSNGYTLKRIRLSEKHKIEEILQK